MHIGIHTKLTNKARYTHIYTGIYIYTYKIQNRVRMYLKSKMKIKFNLN